MSQRFLRSTLVITGALLAALTAGCKRNKPSPDASAGATPKGPGAWSVVAKGVAEDGTLSNEAVLKAFALTVAPLPGVDVPPVDSSVPFCGASAVREALARLDKFPPAQREAITRALEGEGAPGKANALTFSSPRAERYRPEIERAQVWLARFLGRPQLDVRVEWTPILPRGPGGGVVFANARPWCPRRPGASPENRADFREATATEDTSGCMCLVRVASAADQVSSAGKLYEILLHELTHCHQYKVQRGFPAAFVNEGHATWVQSREFVESGRRANDGLITTMWTAYLDGQGEGRLSLASAPHAGGFALFQAMHNEGLDMRGRGLSFMHSGNGFAELTSASTAAASAWASQTLNEPPLGARWVPSGPGLDPDARRQPRALGAVRPGTPRQLTIPTAAQEVAHADIVGADVLEVDVSAGFGRAMFGRVTTPGLGVSSAGAELGWTGPSNFLYCMRPGGCDVGFPLPVGNPVNGILVAATGGPLGGARVSLMGLSEQEVRDRSTCVYGRWKYDDSSALARIAARVQPPTRVRSVSVDDVMELNRAGTYREDVRASRVVLETGGGLAASTATGNHTGRFTVTGNRITATGLQQHLSVDAQIQIGGRWIRTPMTLPDAVAIGSALSGQPVPGAPSTSSVTFRCSGADLFIYGPEGVNHYTRL